MNVCFMFAGDLPDEIAMAHVISVRRAIPGAWVIQLSDETTPRLRFVDEIRRKQYQDLIDMRFAHMEDLPGENIVLDYDCVVQDDIRAVFNEPFDLAFTRRPDGDVTASASVLAQSPHNLGVIFQRESGQAFWARVRKGWLAVDDRDRWMDGQVLVSRCIRELGFNVLELPGETYNYTPTSEDEDVSRRAVVHYKGKRKAWMVQGEEAKAKALAEGKRVLRIMSGKA